MRQKVHFPKTENKAKHGESTARVCVLYPQASRITVAACHVKMRFFNACHRGRMTLGNLERDKNRGHTENDQPPILHTVGYHECGVAPVSMSNRKKLCSISFLVFSAAFLFYRFTRAKAIKKASDVISMH